MRRAVSPERDQPRRHPEQHAPAYSNNIDPARPQFAKHHLDSAPGRHANDYVILPVLGQPGVRYVLGPARADGQADRQGGRPAGHHRRVGRQLHPHRTGQPAWDAVAKANFHQLLAIELDGVIQSAPVIQPTQATFTSFAGSGQISGFFTESSAKNLAIAMEFGALPVRLQALTTQTVSPTLGHSSLVAGLGAGLVGLRSCCSTRSCTTAPWAS